MYTVTSRTEKLFFVLFLFSAASVIFMIKYTHKETHVRQYGYKLSSSSQSVDIMKEFDSKENIFPSQVLTCMMIGTWQRRNLTNNEEKEIEDFLHKAFSEHFIPTTLERLDGRCGNVTFEPITSSNISFEWVRALCNPKGGHPCCYEGRCVAAREEECRCKNCADVRQQIHAEYSTWIPKDSSCPPETVTHEEACRLLNGSSLVFMGDSFLRHLYTSLLMLLRNDSQEGAMKRNVSHELRRSCRGMYIFTEKECRTLLDSNTTVCNNTVSLSMKSRFKVAFAPNFTHLVGKLAQRRSFLVLGNGIHDEFQPKAIWHGFLKPLIQSTSGRKWPRVLWTSSHAPGLLKTISKRSQNRDNVLKFNRQLAQLLKPYDFPIFDTFPLTDGVMSFDGSHYGLGVNVMKAQIFLNYVKELESQDLW